MLSSRTRSTGAKVWLVRLPVDGKRRDMGRGRYPLVSLKTARQEAETARRLAVEGSGPIARRDRDTVDRKAGTARRPKPRRGPLRQ